ncbi:MAG: hypothetical protein Q8P54_02080 [bacterium]|nr:hypothetical protein [bacterium]
MNEDRWQTMPFNLQMANIASEIHKAINRTNEKETKLARKHIELALDMLSMSKSKRNIYELSRLYEFIAGSFINPDISHLKEAEKYSLSFY